MFKDSKRLTATDTLIGQGTTLEGSITSESNLRIEGNFQGDISTKGDIIVGEFSVTKAVIQCTSLTIAGQVHGDVSVTGRLIITPSGHLIGNAVVQSIIVQEGGSFNGNCKMSTAIRNDLNQYAKTSDDKQEKQEKPKAKQAV